MKIKGRLVDVIKDYGTNEYDVVFRTRDDVRRFLEDYKGKDLAIDFKIYREMRSNEANKYMWVLITKIAQALNNKVPEIYMNMIRDYGIQYEMVIPRSANPSHLFDYYKRIRRGKLRTRYHVYIGTSHYDTKQMSKFIDGVIYEAKELGIETMTPRQIAEMKARIRDELDE